MENVQEIDMIRTNRVKKALDDIKKGNVPCGRKRTEQILADEVHGRRYCAGTISRVANGKLPVSEAFARFISEAHGNIRVDYLMGRDCYKTEAEKNVSEEDKAFSSEVFLLKTLQSIGVGVNATRDGVILSVGNTSRFFALNSDYERFKKTLQGAVFGVVLSYLSDFEHITITADDDE